MSGSWCYLRDTTVLAIPQLFPFGEGKEERRTATAHQLRLGALRRSAARDGGDVRATSLAFMENGDGGNQRNLRQMKTQANYTGYLT